MNYQEFSQLFSSFLHKNGISTLAEDKIEAFFTFTEHLLKVNQVTNLTAIRDIPGVITKHYVDSLLAMDFIPQDAKVLDIGCGPGFPTIPLAIARPDLNITSLDSTQKKINFVEESTKLLHLSNVTAISARAEDHDLLRKLGKFDVVISRAVAKLNVLCELSIPYVKTGGFLLAMKAARGDEELAEATNAIKILCDGTATIHKRDLVTESAVEERSLIIINKAKETPALYPRPYATIKKKEL